MSSKSRWADTEEDARIDAKLKREKEEKRRKKAEKAQKLEAEKLSQEQAAAQNQANSLGVDDDGRPSKRRRLTPEPGASTSKPDDAPPAKLLRFQGGSWAKSRSVENYDKLNDIEEGTYGWVARATERATGRIVALKRLKLDPADRGGLPVTGLREIQILKDCMHRNIVAMEEVVVGDDVSRPDK
ncbi:CMGC/CDK protein kinase [Ilyonectria robusta]